MAILNNSNAISSGGYDINNSLRFRASASAYLNRTFTTPTNNKIFTLSSWVKRGALGASQFELFTAGTSGSNYLTFQFGADKLNFISETPSLVLELRTTQVFRDPSAWYHIVLAVDTTQATSTNRVKIYVNGTQVTSFSTATYPAQNLNLLMNSAVANYFGYNLSGGGYYDGYLTEANFVDGQQLTPSSFGETDTTTGSWKPKAYTGTYGTNGFYLKFSDIATTSGSNAGLGKDFSGNANYWTTNNISVTAGVTYDAMLDVPTNTSATVANYATLNPLNKGTAASASNGNLNYSCGANSLINGTIGITSGKWYWEIQSPTASSTIGIVNSSASLNNYVGQNANGWAYYGFNGQKFNGSGGVAYGSSYTTTDIIGVAFDADAGTLTFYKNNTSQGTAFTGIAANTYFPSIGDDTTGNTTGAINFGQRPFTYTAPSGFVALNTYNLPTPTILQGNKYMDATLYTGTGATASITNAASFKPDFVWIKCRSGIQDNTLFDSVRGTTKYIISNSTAAEVTDATTLTAFNSNGWTMGLFNQINNNASTYVGWQWQANQGSTVSNTSGSITSTVSANATAGFSVVTYTGTGANATVGHGLGVAPKMIIVKDRGTTDVWMVYHSSLGATKYIVLNLTSAAATLSTVWNNTEPTSSVFSVGTVADTNRNTFNLVAYCWAEIAGFSKFGSYTGNGSADGPFNYLGFRPKFVILKRTDSTGNWGCWDTARDTYNGVQYELVPNASDAETTAAGIRMDILSNGFKLRNTGVAYNASSGTYIYMAFAENPFKNANAR